MRSLTVSSLIHAGLLGIALVCGLTLSQSGPGRVHTVVVAAVPEIEPFAEPELVEPEAIPDEPEELDDLAPEDAPFEEPLPEPLPEEPRPTYEAPRFGPGFYLARHLRHVEEVREEPDAAEETSTVPPAPIEPPQAASEPAAASIEESVLIEAPSPVYPRGSIRRGEEGRCRCRLYVAADGRVSRVEILESSGYDRLDEAARKALLQWRFRPRTEDGVAVPDEIDHPVSFRLE